MFNEKMLNMERLLELIFIEALINKIYNYSLWERLYTLPDKTLLSVEKLYQNGRSNHKQIKTSLFLAIKSRNTPTSSFSYRSI